MNKVDFEIDAINKVDHIKQLALHLCTSVGLKADNLYDAGLIHDLASQVFYILDGVLSAKSEENEEEPLDGLAPAHKATGEVGYDWWDVEKDGIPELEPEAEYMYTWNSQQGRELVARRAGDRFYAIGHGLYDRDTVTSGDRVIRICKTRGVD